MNDLGLTIGDLIEVPPVETVIRLDDAAANAERITTTFALTSDVAAHLHVLCRALLQETGRGYFLQGDFGSGKSHFLAALAAWLSRAAHPGEVARTHDGLTALAASGRRFLPVPISLVNYRAATSLERILTEAIEAALAERGTTVAISPLALFRARLADIVAEPSLAQSLARETGGRSADLPSWFRSSPGEAYAASVRFLKREGIALPETLVQDRQALLENALSQVLGAGYSGIVLLVDELSEFFRSKTDAAQLNEDARTLQLVGEFAGRNPLWVVAAVQESIESTGDIASATFRKIKDRFPVKFMLSRLHIRELIAKRLVKKKEGADSRIYDIYGDYGKNFRSFSCDWNEFRDIYPIHPSTLTLLEGLGALFSQHRGIVDFVHAQLAGDPARGIEGILARPAAELLAPDSIYDHFVPRLFEFSAFNVYPRHIVPHLDEVIERTVEDPLDRPLARRVVRILVLHAIHPTASVPTARDLAELAGCMLFAADRDAGALFVAGALLDPLVEQSRYLTKEVRDADPLKAVYRVSTEDDTGKILKARVRAAMSEIKTGDTRLVLGPLREIAASPSWPGTEIMEHCIDRSFQWRLTSRRASIGLLTGDTSDAVASRVKALVDEGYADCGLLICAGKAVEAPANVAVWHMGGAGEAVDTLKEYLAGALVRDSLNVANPAEAPLIPLADDALRRLRPVAHDAVLKAVYGGRFTDRNITVEPAALQMRRFDRVVECAGAGLLDKRFPRFVEIAPKLLPPTPRVYDQLHEGFVVPGSITLAEARSRGLTDALDSIATPLGLVEVKAGTYRLAPSPESNRFLSHLFERLGGVGHVPLRELTGALRTGPWGVPDDMAHFVLAALTHAGLVSLTAGGRTTPIDFVRPHTVANADSVAPGELLAQGDREFLMAECPFLAPPSGFGTFGLRQQRDVWLAVQKFRKQVEGLTVELETRIRSAMGFSAFDGFDFETVRGTIKVLSEIAAEVKVSYTAREGLERFLGAWRRAGLTADDTDRIVSLNRFLKAHGEQFVFTVHYMRSRSVENAAAADEKLAGEYDHVMRYIAEPRLTVVPDEGARLAEAFDLFRSLYTERYGEGHARHYQGADGPRLGKGETRGLALLRRLAAVRSLDRPAPLERLFAALDSQSTRSCRRLVHEELLRAPMCACGYVFGDTPPSPVFDNPGEVIEECLRAYFVILSAPAVREPLAARAFALRDTDPATAKKLQRIGEFLGGSEPKGTGRLMDMLDEHAVEEIDRAMSSTTVVEDRNLSDLVTSLAGRRLPPARVRAEIDKWLGEAGEDTILSIGGRGVAEQPRETPDVGWWALVHRGLLERAGKPASWSPPPPDAERALEAAFPSSRLRDEVLRDLETSELAGFLSTEPLHTKAMAEAWRLLAERVFQRHAAGAAIPTGSACLAPDLAVQWSRRLAVLHALAALDGAAFPERLALRVHCASIIHDPLATGELRRMADRLIDDAERQGRDWLASLPPVAPVRLEDKPLVVIVDGLPIDVWLESCESLTRACPGYRARCHRLDAATVTVPALQHLFGLAADRDPVDALAEVGVVYETLRGDEKRPAQDLVTRLQSSSAAVVRFSLLDSAIHRGEARLCDLPALAERLFAEHMPGLVAACRQAHRPCVLTTDHGLTYNRGGLSHGKGGVFEQAVVTVEWQLG